MDKCFGKWGLELDIISEEKAMAKKFELLNVKEWMNPWTMDLFVNPIPLDWTQSPSHGLVHQWQGRQDLAEVWRLHPLHNVSNSGIKVRRRNYKYSAPTRMSLLCVKLNTDKHGWIDFSTFNACAVKHFPNRRRKMFVLTMHFVDFTSLSCTR